jgi:hypothetical protein
MSADEIASAFVSHFYQTFSAGGAAQLAGLYVSKKYSWLLLVNQSSVSTASIQFTYSLVLPTRDEIRDACIIQSNLAYESCGSSESTVRYI